MHATRSVTVGSSYVGSTAMRPNNNSCGNINSLPDKFDSDIRDADFYRSSEFNCTQRNGLSGCNTVEYTQKNWLENDSKLAIIVR